MNQQERLTRLAELTVKVGANVQPGQLVVVTGLVEHAALMREIARAAYGAGARLVEPVAQDRDLTKALMGLGPDESIGATAPWLMSMMKTLVAEKGAYIQVTADAEPTLLSDLDGSKVGRSRPRELLQEWGRVIDERLVNLGVHVAPPGGGGRPG